MPATCGQFSFGKAETFAGFFTVSKKTQQIIEKIRRLEAGKNAVLATVVELSGSGYRLPGAKMLIAENGDTFGTVSGGFLETDVLGTRPTSRNERQSRCFHLRHD